MNNQHMGWRCIIETFLALIAGVWLAQAGAQIAAAEETIMPLGDFSQDTKKWQLVLGNEFPGAKGTLELAADADDPQRKNLKLSADFSGGGRYVGINRQFPQPLDILELRLTLRTGGKKIGLRMVDSQGQNFQQYLTLTPANPGWQEVRVREFGNPARKDIFYWGGAKDGVWRGPAKSVMLLLEVSKDQPVNGILFREITAQVGGLYPQLSVRGAPLSCYLTPGQPATLEWKAQMPAGTCDPATLFYTVLDYRGRTAQEGQAQIAGDVARATLSLPIGYYDITFSKAGGQTFGVVSLPAFAGQRDPFFCIDAAFGCFPQGGNKPLRNAYYDLAVRCGIDVLRERFFGWSLQSLQEKGAMEWKPEQKALREETAAHGLKTLENFCVAQQRKPDPYPEDLLKAAQGWRDFVSAAGSAAAGVEVWNEPDIFAGGMVPGDHYTALQRAIAFANDQLPQRPLLCAGVFNHVKKPVFDTYALNGLLANSDVLAYHDYYPEPEKCEWLISQYRQWCAEYGAPGIPIWMSEAGSGWTRGPARPPLGEAAKSAYDIALKAVECRACGNERHFPFLLVFFEENKVNWGMHAKDETPLRSIGAYAACIRNLAGTRYLGDLRGEFPQLLRARVFAANEAPEAIIVLCTPGLTAGSSVRLPFAPTHIEGIDGRMLALANGAVPCEDGVVYVRAPLAAVRPFLNADTPAMRLTKQAAQGGFRRAPASALVLQPILNASSAGFSPKGYSPRDPAKVQMRATLYNLSAQEQPYEFEVQAPDGVSALPESQNISGTLPATSSKELCWELNLEQAMRSGKGDVDLRIVNRLAPACYWGMRFIRTEIAIARRNNNPDAGLSPRMQPDPSAWKLLAEEAYVPFGFVIYDRKTKVWARCSWSERQLNLDVLVEKQGFHQSWTGDKTWMGDSVQFALHYPALPGSKEGADFFEFAAALTPQGAQLYRHHSARAGEKPGIAGGDLPCSVTRDGDRVLYSVRLPVAALGYPELKKGDVLRFSLLANYNDGLARAGYFHWGDGIVAAKSPAEYCVLRLED